MPQVMSVTEQRTDGAWQCRRLETWATFGLVLIVVLLSTTILKVVLEGMADERLPPPPAPRPLACVNLVDGKDIFDRRGRLIATTTLGHRAFIDPSRLDDPAPSASISPH